MNVIQHHIHRVFNKYVFDGLRDRKDMLAMQALEPLSQQYLPWSQVAMRASAVAAVCNDIIINRRQVIVECGAGISTFYIARLLRERGGRLHTIEDNQEWSEILRRQLREEGLADHVSVVHAPLRACKSSWDGAAWYDESSLREIRDRGGIDLLIVDGPAAYNRQLMHARYPAAPFFAPGLAQDYTIVLDDINRRGEQEVLERWERELGIRFERRFVDGTIGVARPRGSFTV